MPEFNVEVEFDVFCTCGAALCNDAETTDYRRGRQARALIVGPCTACLDKSYDEGHGKGYDEAKEEDA